MTEIITQFQPDYFAIEQVFMAKNADSALKLGQARGVAIVAAVNQELPVFEYAARQVKQTVVGMGSAESQVQHMVRTLLKLPLIHRRMPPMRWRLPSPTATLVRMRCR